MTDQFELNITDEKATCMYDRAGNLMDVDPPKITLATYVRLLRNDVDFIICQVLDP